MSSSFTFGRPTATLGSSVPFRPTAGHDVEWVLPPSNQQNSQQYRLQLQTARNQGQQQKIKRRSNLEWRLEITRVYSTLLSNIGQKATLHSTCEINDYKRLKPVWKDLQLEKLLQLRVPIDNERFQMALDSRFPLTESKEAVTAKSTRASKPKTRRSNEEWRQLLTEMYDHLYQARENNQKDTIKTYLADVLQLPTEQNRRIYTVWNEIKLNESLEQGVPITDPDLLLRIHEKYPTKTDVKDGSARFRDCSVESNSYFSKSEEEMLVHLAAGLAKLGFPMNKCNLHDLCNQFLKAEDPDCVAANGVGIATVERMYKYAEVEAKCNVNPIDPKRAAQADPQVLNVFYHQLDETIKVLHEIDPVSWPEDRYSNIPPTRIYNCDEQGPNPTKLRSPVLIPKDMIKGSQRLFQNTREGDGKMAFHYSVANIVRADGVQCIPHDHIEGAPAPYVLVSDAGSGEDLDSMDKADRDKALANQSENDYIELNDAILEGWFDPFVIGNKETMVNRFGFQIRATPSGSMLKRTFFDFITHFIKQLPQGQGRRGKGVVLHLDWHSSRECPQSLLTSLFIHNVLIMVLPSKSSIWSQPCDCGKNEKTAISISKAGHDLGMLNGKPLDYYDANKIFRIGLETNCLEQNDELRRTGSNAVVSSFEKTGLYPMSYDNEGWKTAFFTFGKLNKLMKTRRIEAGEKVPEITWVVKAKRKQEREELSTNESALIQSFLQRHDFLCDNIDAGGDTAMNIPPLLLAMSIAERMIGVYNQNLCRDMTTPPKATDALEAAALKLVHFVGITVNDRVNTTCTLPEETIARDKLQTQLDLLPFGESIRLCKRGSSSSKTVSITKQGANKFIRLDGDQRESINFNVLTTTQVLDRYLFDHECEKLAALANPLTAQDKKKERKKEKIRRKKLNEAMSEKATAIAHDRRQKRNQETIEERMTQQISASFVSGLKDLLEKERSSMEALYTMWELTLFEPYTDTIAVTNDEGDGEEKEFDVTVVGSDVSAVSHKASLTFLDLFQKLQEQRSNRTRRKRKRGPGQSTHLGKPGWVAGILIQRAAQQDEKAALEKTKKAAQDEISKLQSLLDAIEEIKAEMPDMYWSCEKLRGKKRTTMARLFDVFRSSMKAQETETALRSLNLTRDVVDRKIDEIKAKLAAKTAALPAMIAEIRERDDFIEGTNQYDDDGNEDGGNESDNDALA